MDAIVDETIVQLVTTDQLGDDQALYLAALTRVLLDYGCLLITDVLRTAWPGLEVTVTLPDA